MVKRDNSIDFFRGVAAIWIIFIHTCFWSGEVYVPVWLKSLSLIIDVPLFIFISGMTFNFSNDFRIKIACFDKNGKELKSALFENPEYQTNTACLENGYFAVFEPGEAHKPQMNFEKYPAEVKKVVVKICVE